MSISKIYKRILDIVSDNKDMVYQGNEMLGISLEQELQTRLPFPLKVAVRPNLKGALRVRRKTNYVALSVHPVCLNLTKAELDAVSELLKEPSRERYAKVELIVEKHKNESPEIRRAPRVMVRTKGEIFDLQEIRSKVNEAYFNGKVDAQITWGRRSTKRRRGIQFGSYEEDRHLIRIHPALDEGFVPLYFIEYVVYHEMLHAHLGIRDSFSGGIAAHTREFRILEKQYKNYEQAREWETSNISRFMS